MRFLFNAFKKLYWLCDRLWVYTTGRCVCCYAAITSSVYREKAVRRYSHKPLYFYGLHQTINDGNCSAFGIDAPDDMILEINFREHKPIPSVGDLICFYNDSTMGQWEVTSRSLPQYRYLGQSGRLELLCTRYAESTTNSESEIEEPCHK